MNFNCKLMRNRHTKSLQLHVQYCSNYHLICCEFQFWNCKLNWHHINRDTISLKLHVLYIASTKTCFNSFQSTNTIRTVPEFHLVPPSFWIYDGAPAFSLRQPQNCPGGLTRLHLPQFYLNIPPTVLTYRTVPVTKYQSHQSPYISHSCSHQSL